MIVGFKTALLILYATYAADAIRSRTKNNQTTITTTTSKPFRLRLRWPGSRPRNTTTFTTTTASVASTENSTITELVSEKIHSNESTTDSSIITKATSGFESTSDPFSGFIQLFHPTVSHESTISAFPTDGVPFQEATPNSDGNATTAVNFSTKWNLSDEIKIVPSIYIEPIFNFSLAEENLKPAIENVSDEINPFVPDLKIDKYSRPVDENGPRFEPQGTTTVVPSYVVSVIQYETDNSNLREYRKIYTTEPTKSQSEVNASTTTTSTANDLQVSTGGTYVYVVSIVGIIPTVGMIMWCARQVLSRPQKSKEATKTTSYCTVDFSSGETRRDYNRSANVPDQPNDKILQTTVFQTLYSCVQYGSSHVKNSWKRMHLEYPRQNLELNEVLGEGNFGIVWKAEAIDIEEPRHRQVVAVKTVKESASCKERHELLRELQIMELFDDHPNVVRLLGCCTETEPFFLIMEFVKKGKLQSFLRDHRSKRKYYNSSSDGLSSRDLTTFAYQIANGMEYISRVGVIHRDLAARNILVDHNNVCKIADFGLSRTTDDGDNGLYEQKTKGALPIRWMAPESLYLSIFTSKSDVWAFGILLWEIVTLGSTPYPGMGAREVIHHVQKGNIMECPDHCHPDLYSVMCACWMADPNSRPSFTSLRGTLGSHLEIQAGYVDLDHFPESSFYNLYQSPGEKV